MPLILYLKSAAKVSASFVAGAAAATTMLSQPVALESKLPHFENEYYVRLIDWMTSARTLAETVEVGVPVDAFTPAPMTPPLIANPFENMTYFLLVIEMFLLIARFAAKYLSRPALYRLSWLISILHCVLNGLETISGADYEISKTLQGYPHQVVDLNEVGTFGNALLVMISLIFAHVQEYIRAKQLGVLHAALAGTTKRLVEIEQEKKSLAEEHSAAIDEKNKALDDVFRLEQEIQTLKTEYSSVTKEIERALESMSVLEQTVGKSEARSLCNQKEKTEADGQKQSMEGRVKELTEDLRRANEEVNLLQAEVNVMGKERAAAVENYSLIKETSETLEAKLKNATTRILQLQVEISAASNEKKIPSHIADMDEANVGVVKNQLDELQEKYNAVVHRHSALEKEMKKVEVERVQYETEHKKLKSEVDELYAMMEEECTTPNQLSEDLAVARKKSKETFDQLENTVDKLTTLTKAHRILQDEHDDLSASKAALKLSHTRLEIELDKVKERVQAPEEPGRVAVLELDLRRRA
ncbi:MAG: hypothetical protein MMC33_007442 [Icmadophila ericetorum]|nr:hypothetical protein [Icmadophila ericetorum]